MPFSFEDCFAFFLASLLESVDWGSLGLLSCGDATGDASGGLVPTSVSGESVGRCRLVDFDMGRHCQLLKLHFG
jgi:hypothetical protein